MIGRFYGGRRINAGRGGVRKCERRRRSVLEYGPALRTLRVRLFHVGAAVRAGERGRLGGFAAERQRGLRALLRILRRGPFRLLGGAGQRLGPSLPLARRIPPQEEDREVRDDREDGDLGERGHVQEEAVERPARGGHGAEVGSCVRPIGTLVRHRKRVSINGISERLIDHEPAPGFRVVRAGVRPEVRHRKGPSIEVVDSQDHGQIQENAVVAGYVARRRGKLHPEREGRLRRRAVRTDGPVREGHGAGRQVRETLDRDGIFLRKQRPRRHGRREDDRDEEDDDQVSREPPQVPFPEPVWDHERADRHEEYDQASERAQSEDVQLGDDDAEEDQVRDPEPHRGSELLEPGSEGDEKFLAGHETRRCGRLLNRYAATLDGAFSRLTSTAEPSYRLVKIARAFRGRASYDEARRGHWWQCASAAPWRCRGGPTPSDCGDRGGP